MAKKIGNLVLKLQWQRRKKIIERQMDALISKLKEKALSHSVEESRNLFSAILDLSELHRIAVELSSQKDKKELIYIIPSLFLIDCHNYLKQQEEESLHFVTGVEIDNVVVLDRIVKIDLEKQSVVYARADSISVRKVLVELTRYDYKLFAYFHIHPGLGKEATHPSDIDMRLDKLLRQGNYKTIGAIFSRDGFVRFFSNGKKFEIQIYGKGVREIDAKTFELTEAVKIPQI
ncbi:MAG: hypothetical protein AB1393_07690 [Candidatus Edwardsbacteria bacterium]